MKKIMEKSICPKCKRVYINEEIMSSYGDMAIGMKKNRITHCTKCNKKLVSEKLLDNFDENGDLVIKYCYMELGNNVDSWDICVAVRDLISKISNCEDITKIVVENICETIPVEEPDMISLVNSYFSVIVEISKQKYEIAKVKLYSYYNKKGNRGYNGFKNKELCTKTLLMTNNIFEGTTAECVGIKNLEEMYYVGLSNRSLLLESIPEEMRTEKICLEAAKTEYGAQYYYEHIPKKYLTEKWYITALESQSIILLDIPEKMRTYNVIMAALKAKGVSPYARTSILRILPKRMLTREFCKEAVRLAPDELQYVPPKVLNEEICLIALKSVKDKTKGKRILKYIPITMLTDEMKEFSENWQ